jgi:hypothetical protein
MHTSSSRAFQRHQEHGSEASWVCGSHNYKTKQNKLPSFIDRYPLEITKSQFLKMALGPVIQKVINQIYNLGVYICRNQRYTCKRLVQASGVEYPRAHPQQLVAHH